MEISTDPLAALSEAESLLTAGPGEGVMVELANRLIAIYDSSCWSAGDRERAAQLASVLASRSNAVLDLVIGNAQRYGKLQHIDDAFPYCPNSFDVLAMIADPHEKTIRFLHRVIAEDCGTPQAHARDTLFKLGLGTKRDMLEGAIGRCGETPRAA